MNNRPINEALIRFRLADGRSHDTTYLVPIVPPTVLGTGADLFEKDRLYQLDGQEDGRWVYREVPIP